MSAEQVALDHYQDQQRLANAAADVAGDAWGQVDPDNISGSWRTLSPEVTVAVAGAQRAAAQAADGYLNAVLAEQNLSPAAVGGVASGAFAGIASDGRPLASLLDQPRVGTLAALRGGHPVDRSLAMGRAGLDMIVRTQVADAGRTADQAALVARPATTGYVRMLVPPSCSRCAILAGRWYRYSAGFQRHPRCDCRHIPSIEANATNLVTNPRAYFDSLSEADQDRLFTAAGARAIRDGADMSQVVNARRGMFTAGGRRLTRESTTRLGAARPGRLMPEQIYRQARSRDEAVELLRDHGYLRSVPASRLAPAGPGGRLVPESDLPSAQRLLDSAEPEVAARQVYEGTFAGIRTTVTKARHLDNRKVLVTGELRDSTDTKVGDFSRLVMRNDDGATLAYHDALEIDPSVQGQGFAQAFNSHLERWYRASGVEHVELYANIDIGGYAWARSGYTFAHLRAAERVMHRLRRQLDSGQLDERVPIPPADVAAARELLARAERVPFGSAGYPTAYEVSQLGRLPGAGRDDMWLGKRVLLGSNWDAVKPL